MTKIKHGIALLGCGTVGSGVFALLRRQAADIQSRYGYEFEVRKILVRDPKKARTGITGVELTDDFQDILSDEGIDIVIEVMGGESPAREYIQDALKSGKHVITANKALMGGFGEKLVEKARQHDRFFGYSAAITGFHQLIPSVVKSIMISELVGIFNGTSNYILTGLKDKPFKDVLDAAIRAGYAEADHRSDTEGFDTRNKLVLATRLAFGVFLDRNDISVTGITGISDDDMRHAAAQGYTIKLLGISRLVEPNKLAAFVAPALVQDTDPLAKVNGVDNALFVNDRIRGVQGMTAGGAGGDVTAMAIFSDLISLARGESTLWPAPSASAKSVKLSKNLPPARHYIRVDARNEPGALARITKVFAQHQINIDEVVQKAKSKHDEIAPIRFVFGMTDPKKISKAIAQLTKSGAIGPKPVVLRIESSPIDVALPIAS